jgi:hypothetical protein
MLRPQGYATIIPAEGRVIEYDTVSCAHCQRIVFVKPRTLSRVYLFPQMDGTFLEEPGAGCLKCGKPICLRCCDVGTCTPAEKMLEFMEAVGRHL